MNAASRRVQKVYLLLLLLHTLAASFIWGINTLFLLDAGLSNTEAFAANAFFTAGMVICEIPTGVIADTRGRRTSYLLGTLTLAISTVLYLLMWRISAPFWAWALGSALLGLGFTFFSGAVEAWLVDALTYTGYLREGGTLEAILARGEIVEGIAMLGGSVAGGVIAQATNLGVPYILRAIVLAITFLVAFIVMRDIGFTPSPGKDPLKEVKHLLRRSIEHGLGNPPVKWVMLAGPFTGGVSIYAFYAMQPYLLQLYGDTAAYSVAGLAAAIVAGAQIAGGLLVPYLGRVIRRRTSVLLAGTALSTLALVGIGLSGFWMAVVLLGFMEFDVFGAHARASGIPEWAHRFQRARDRAVVRLADGIGGRGRRPAGAWQGCGRMELSGLLHLQRRDPGAGPSVPLAGAARARRYRCDFLAASVSVRAC